jgi:hypothetical protein
MRLSLFVAVFVSLLVSVADAQSFYSVRRERSLILVAGTGSSTYFGELANDGDYFDAKLNVNAGLQYFFGNHISARAEITWFSLKGSDAIAADPGRVPRNLSFNSNNYEISGTAAFSFFSNGNRFYRRPGINIYGFAGLGFIFFNPTTMYNGDKVALQPLQTELVPYNRFGLVIPYGLGLRLKVAPLFNISIEGGYRTTFTDYLDDVSTTHKDPSKFTNPLAAALSDRRPEIGRPIVPDGTQRGNPKTNDGYMLVNAKLEYYLPWDFTRRSSYNPSYNNKKRTSNYRYNKRGGLRR